MRSDFDMQRLVAEVLSFFDFRETDEQLTDHQRRRAAAERGFYECHAREVISTLMALRLDTTVNSVLQHMNYNQLLELSYDLPREEARALRGYLADLPDWVLASLEDCDRRLTESGSRLKKSVA